MPIETIDDLLEPASKPSQESAPSSVPSVPTEVTQAPVVDPPSEPVKLKEDIEIQVAQVQ